jgi:hypothetical protein
MNVRRAIARYPLSSSLSMKPPRRNAEYTFSVFKFVVLLDENYFQYGDFG